MNKPLDPTPREPRQNSRDAPRSTLTLTPAYRWLIMLNLILATASFVLRLAATARGH